MIGNEINDPQMQAAPRRMIDLSRNPRPLLLLEDKGGAVADSSSRRVRIECLAESDAKRCVPYSAQ